MHASSILPLHKRSGMIDDVFYGEAIVLEDVLGRGAGANLSIEIVPPWSVTYLHHPSEAPGLDRQARRHVGGQDFVAIALVLLIEQLPRRHADDAGVDALLFQLRLGPEG